MLTQAPGHESCIATEIIIIIIIIHPDSRKYTCMAIDIGRFQWKRLQMGTIVASNIFQKKLDSVYIGLPGVTGIEKQKGKTDYRNSR